jgi:hypothetical protein
MQAMLQIASAASMGAYDCVLPTQRKGRASHKRKPRLPGGQKAGHSDGLMLRSRPKTDYDQAPAATSFAAGFASGTKARFIQLRKKRATAINAKPMTTRAAPTPMVRYVTPNELTAR